MSIACCSDNCCEIGGSAEKDTTRDSCGCQADCCAINDPRKTATRTTVRRLWV